MTKPTCRSGYVEITFHECDENGNDMGTANKFTGPVTRYRKAALTFANAFGTAVECTPDDDWTLARPDTSTTPSKGHRP